MAVNYLANNLQKAVDGLTPIETSIRDLGHLLTAAGLDDGDIILALDGLINARTILERMHSDALEFKVEGAN